MIRHYKNGDEAAVVDLWNRACPQDPISMQMFIKRVLVDPNFEPEGLMLFEEQGRIVGAILAIVRHLPLSGGDLEPDDGWITTFFVSPDHRGRGIGQSLVSAAEGFFRDRGRKNIYFSSYAPNYFVPGIDADRYPAGKRLLERSGFRVLYSPVAMDKNLVDYAYPDDVRELAAERRRQGYVFEYLSAAYVVDAVRFNHSVFNPDWARAVREAIAHGSPMDRVLIARKEDQVVGFCMYGAYDDVAERFGPFGVHPDLRGTGLGKVLLYQCLHEMRAHGFHNAWFLWTGETSPAGYLYFRAGFHVTRKFDVMRKDLNTR